MTLLGAWLVIAYAIAFMVTIHLAFKRNDDERRRLFADSHRRRMQAMRAGDPDWSLIE